LDKFDRLKYPPVIEEATMTECIECGAELTLHDDLETGEIVDCTTCGTELEVIDVNPPVLDRAPELEEDWGE